MRAVEGSAGDVGTEQQRRATRTMDALPAAADPSSFEIELDVSSDEDADLNPDARTPSRWRLPGRTREPVPKGLIEAGDHHPLSAPKRTAPEFTPSCGALPAASSDPYPEIVCVDTPKETRTVLPPDAEPPARYEPYTRLQKRILFSFCFLILLLLLCIAVMGHIPPTDDYVRATVDGTG